MTHNINLEPFKTIEFNISIDDKVSFILTNDAQDNKAEICGTYFDTDFANPDGLEYCITTQGWCPDAPDRSDCLGMYVRHTTPGRSDWCITGASKAEKETLCSNLGEGSAMKLDDEGNCVCKGTTLLYNDDTDSKFETVNALIHSDKSQTPLKIRSTKQGLTEQMCSGLVDLDGSPHCDPNGLLQVICPNIKCEIPQGPSP